MSNNFKVNWKKSFDYQNYIVCRYIVVACIVMEIITIRYHLWYLSLTNLYSIVMGIWLSLRSRREWQKSRKEWQKQYDQKNN